MTTSPLPATGQTTDLVNAHFRKFYPADWDSNWETEYCAGSYNRRYQGDRNLVSTIFPAMICADGFTMSVQGHFGAYSEPRDDFAKHYNSVEIMCPAEPLLEVHGGHACGDEMIYGYVPIETVAKIIEKHGGLVDAALALAVRG